MLTKTKMVWKNITVEPLAFLTTLIMALSGIAANDLYLQKACQVSFTLVNLDQPTIHSTPLLYVAWILR